MPDDGAADDPRVPVRLSERLCMWSAAPIAVVMTAGFVLGGLIPPPRPDASAAEIAAFYFDHPDLSRLGITLMSIGGLFILPFGIAMAAQIRRVEGPGSVMASVMVASTAFVATATCMYLFILLTLTYRPDRAPDQLMMLNDMAWVPFIGMWQPGAAQAIAVGIAVLSDRRPGRAGHLPRWVGWISLWYAFSSLVGAFVPFTMGGPLSWNGLIPFYLGATMLFGWWIVIAVMMLRTTRVMTSEECDAQTEVAS